VVLTVDLEVAGRHHRTLDLDRRAVLKPGIAPAGVLAVEHQPTLVGQVLLRERPVATRV